SISPNAGASAWVVSVETPKRPSAAARRVAGAKTTASVDAALNAAAKARPCTMRSRYIAGPIACTNRKAAEAAADAVEDGGDDHDRREPRDAARAHHEPDGPLGAAERSDVQRQKEERGEVQKEKEVGRRDAHE